MTNKKTLINKKISNFTLLHIAFLIYSFVIVFSKTAAMAGLFKPTFFIFAIFEILTLGIYAIIWQQVLRKFSLVVAYSNKGIVIIWNLIWAAIFFTEHITIENMIGGVIVIIGIVVVSSDEN